MRLTFSALAAREILRPRLRRFRLKPEVYKKGRAFGITPEQIHQCLYGLTAIKLKLHGPLVGVNVQYGL